MPETVLLVKYHVMGVIGSRQISGQKSRDAHDLIIEQSMINGHIKVRTQPTGTTSSQPGTASTASQPGTASPTKAARQQHFRHQGTGPTSPGSVSNIRETAVSLTLLGTAQTTGHSQLSPARPHQAQPGPTSPQQAAQPASPLTGQMNE